MTLNPDLVGERCQEITDSLARLARFQQFLAEQPDLKVDEQSAIVGASR